MALLVRLRQAARGLTLRALLPLMVKRQALPDLLRSLNRPAAPTADDPRQLAARLFRPLRFWPTTCLYRALGSYALLRAAGLEVRFVIGVRKEGEELLAHAWLERDGATIVGALGEGPPYTVAYAWPADPALQLDRPAGRPGAGLHLSDQVLLTELPDGTGVLLHLQTRFYFTLNATGLRTWRLLAAGARDAASLATALAAEFPQSDPAGVRADVEALLAELEREELVVEALRAPEEVHVKGLRSSDEVVLTELRDGTGVLLHVGTKHYFTLNRTGVLAWKLIAAGEAPDAGALARAIADRYPEVDPAAVGADVAALLAELAAEGLLAPAA